MLCYFLSVQSERSRVTDALTFQAQISVPTERSPIDAFSAIITEIRIGFPAAWGCNGVTLAGMFPLAWRKLPKLSCQFFYSSYLVCIKCSDHDLSSSC